MQRLGAGFLEKVYEKRMLHLNWAKTDGAVQQQVPITVQYDGLPVGEYFADLLVEDRIICELKAQMLAIAPEHEVQLVNYLAATGFDIGLLINFGRSVHVRRKYRGHPDTE